MKPVVYSAQNRFAGPARCARNSLGFTLLEVLAVVAVIALLVAVLLPVLSQAREEGRKVACQANLKQLGNAWEMYLRDSREHFPRGGNVEHTYGGRQGEGSWRFGSNPGRPIGKPLNRYLGLPGVVRKSAAVFRCPSDDGTRAIRPSAYEYYGTSYQPNEFLIGPTQIQLDPRLRCQKDHQLGQQINQVIKSLTRSGIDDLFKVVLMGDLPWWATIEVQDPEEEFPEYEEWHHRSRAHNLLYLDSHVEFVQVTKGIYSDAAYTILPTRNLCAVANECQDPVPSR